MSTPAKTSSAAIPLAATTPLAELSLQRLPLILDEVFAIPPPWLFPELPQPTTIGELATATGLDIAAVIGRIKAIQRMSFDLEISPEQLQSLFATAAPPVLVDVREPWEFARCHLPASILLSSVDFAALLPRLQQAERVVVLCHHGVRSYSGALYLRQHGVAQAQSLAGGLDLWAQVIDPSLPRY